MTSLARRPLPALSPLFAAAAVVLAAPAAHAVIRSVGPGQMYPTAAAAAAAAMDGDTIEIAAGTYHEEVDFTRNNLTIRGVGGRVIFDRTGMPLTLQGGKGIFIIDGADATVDGIEFVGAHVESTRPNGAGIRWQGGGRLTVRNCVFRDNEDGILGGNSATNTAVIEFNEFVGNGRGDVGYTHSVYINEIDTVTFRGNWSHALWSGGSDIGHLFKSRAHTTLVLYNRLTAEDTHSSYEVNIPQGGTAYVIGNLIQQRVGSQRIMISFADGDGTQYPGSQLFVVNNTFVNEASGDATFVRTTMAGATVRVVNNLFVGAGTVAMGGMVTMSNNVTTTMPGLVDQAMFDYHLTAGSPAVNAGMDPGSAGAMSLVPMFQYVHPHAIEPRAAVGAIDVGAYEFGNVPGDGGTTTGDGGPPGDAGGTGMDAGNPMGDGGDAGGPGGDGAIARPDALAGDASGPGAMRSGCGCRTEGSAGGARGAGMLLAVAAGVVAARRRRGRDRAAR